MRLSSLLAKALLAAFVMLPLPLIASPIDVSYTVTGSAGNWTLDFSVTNNLTGFPHQSFYFFGVLLSSTNVTGVPTNDGWVVGTVQTPWNTSGSGGLSISYNNVWFDNNDAAGLLTPGTTTTGFDVTITDTVAPTSVDWFAYTFDPTGLSPYTGGGNFDTPRNPGFQGVTSVTAVPEPSTSVLLSTGILSLACAASRKFISHS